jgi:hypothetical protein
MASTGALQITLRYAECEPMDESKLCSWSLFRFGGICCHIPRFAIEDLSKIAPNLQISLV